MTRSRRILALFLLAVWPAVSSHSLLEQLGLIHQDHEDIATDASSHDHESDADDHAFADGDYLRGSREIPDGNPALTAWASLFDVTPMAGVLFKDFEAGFFQTGLPPPGTAPPEISQWYQSWLRVGQPIRAPSFSS